MNTLDYRALRAEIDYRQWQARRSWPQSTPGSSSLRRRLLRLVRRRRSGRIRRTPSPTALLFART